MSQPKQLHLDIKLDESITLDNFISCSSTELVLKATNHFVSNHSSFKTLYLWGKDGVGKNYLLHATNKKCKENNLSSTFFSNQNLNTLNLKKSKLMACCKMRIQHQTLSVRSCRQS